jgi:catechol 2,3-dioxygenase-like lactoylglutathione lyase family enzyme
VETRIETSGIDHVYLAVRDFDASLAFYDRVMRLLGFKKGTFPIAGERHTHYFNQHTQISIRPARSDAAHDPYRAGLHHICLRVDERAAVDAAAKELRALGVEASEPRTYPEYAEDYYATFFEDPDGLRFEIVALRKARVLIREHWHELDDFEDPLRKKGLIK